MNDHVVEEGECLSSIAHGYGFFWETLWNLPENGSLKSTRKDPNVLLAGDVVKIPDLRAKAAAGAAGTRHSFQVKGVPSRLRMTFYFLGKPRSGDRYVLQTDSLLLSGNLDGSGTLDVAIPPNDRTLTLTLGDDQTVYELGIGSLDPISEVRGAQQRLTNLGYACGQADGVLGPLTTQAIKSFQTDQQLAATGTLDGETLDKLKSTHGM